MNQRLRRVMVIAGVLFAGTACGGDSTPETGFRVDTVGGIEHTVAADVPERGEAGLESLWTAPGDREVLEGTDWANPTWISVGEAFVAVFDPQIPRVHLFSLDGERESSFGRAGEGPGELSGTGRTFVDGDSILVLRTMGSLQWFDRAGAFLGTVPQGEGVMMQAQLLPGAGVARQMFGGPSGSMGTQWEFTGWNGERHSFEMPGPHPMQPPVAAGDEAGCWRLGVTADRFLEIDCTFPLLRVVDRHGEVVREHRIDRAPVRTPPDMIEEAIAGLRSSIQVGGSTEIPAAVIDQMIAQQEERMRVQNRWIPAIRSAQGSPSGHRIVIWEQPPENFGGGNAVFHVLDGEGRYLVRHQHDGRITALALSDDLLVVLNEDPEMGLRQLEAFELP